MEEVEYREDNLPWFSTEKVPQRGRHIWVRFKTYPFPTFLSDAYEMSDAYWYAEVSDWKYYQYQTCYPEPERVISPLEFEKGEG